jgi:hypothetical protein
MVHLPSVPAMNDPRFAHITSTFCCVKTTAILSTTPSRRHERPDDNTDPQLTLILGAVTRFVMDDFGGLSLDALEPNAAPCKVMATTLLMDESRRTRRQSGDATGSSTLTETPGQVTQSWAPGLSLLKEPGAGPGLRRRSMGQTNLLSPSFAARSPLS